MKPIDLSFRTDQALALIDQLEALTYILHKAYITDVLTLLDSDTIPDTDD